MLARLSIRDIVLIDRLDLAVEPGLLVLTGETGAGKSILLDAFSLALGGRGDGGLVRHGQPQGQVTAVFDLADGHPARKLATDADIDVDGDLILRRVQVGDGRTRAFVNDQPVSVQILRAIGQQLVEIHGQHDDRALADTDEHRGLLDAFGALRPLAAETAELHRAWRKAETDLATQKARIEKARADADYLRHAADELSTLAPQEGEETQLAERRQRMMQAEKVVGELQEIFDLLAGNASPVPALASAQRRLDRRAEQAPDLAGSAARALDQALIAIEEARDALEKALGTPSSTRASRSRSRSGCLRCAPPAASTMCRWMRWPRWRSASGPISRRWTRGRGTSRIWKGAAAAARQACREKALALSAGRRRAAAELDRAVNAELPPLKLERARFITEVATDEARMTADGIDTVEFHVQTNPAPGPAP